MDLTVPRGNGAVTSVTVCIRWQLQKEKRKWGLRVGAALREFNINAFVLVCIFCDDVFSNVST